MTTAIAINEALDLLLEREVDVPVEKVWAAWTKPEHLVHWFAPKPWSVKECELDVRPGGIFRVVMQSPEGEAMDGEPGCYLEVEHHRKLVWTDALQPGYRPSTNPFFTAILLFEPTASGGTKYTAIAVHRTPEGRKQHEEMGFFEGWGTVLNQLVEYAKANL
jgi:uncharacterized protein YndB with AHSA1/START domain